MPCNFDGPLFSYPLFSASPRHIYGSRAGLISKLVSLLVLLLLLLLIIIIMIILHRTIYSAIIYGAKPYEKVHFGSSEPKSVSGTPLTPGGCQLVGQAANSNLLSSLIGCCGQAFTHRHVLLNHKVDTIRLILIYRPSEGGRRSRPPRHCSNCRLSEYYVSQWFSWNTNFCPQRWFDAGSLAPQASVLPL